MVHQVILAKLKPDLSEDTVEKVMVEARIRLLKIPEIRNLSCGKKIDAKNNPHDFFIAMDFENLSKMRVAADSPIYHQFITQIIEPYVLKQTSYEFEMEPGKDIRYS